MSKPESSVAISFFEHPQRHLALVTGGSRGIGSAIVSELKKQNIQVLAPSRSELDLASPDSVAAFTLAHANHGIDILINNAGINILNPIQQISQADWARMIQVNVTAPMLLIQALSPGMQKNKWGRVVNLSSIFGIVTKKHRAAYSTTKSAINGLTRTAAVELGPDGILVNSICPGYVDTELTRKNNTETQLQAIRQTIPLGRLASTNEIAQLAVFLCSDLNSYITGQSVLIDGGFTCQ